MRLGTMKLLDIIEEFDASGALVRAALDTWKHIPALTTWRQKRNYHDLITSSPLKI
jgi:hypothetical protein